MILTTTYTVDISKPLLPTPLQQMLITKDKGANRLAVELYQNGVPFSPGGMCAGFVVRRDGSTVPLTGTVDGSLIYVDLPAAAYTLDGPISIGIKNVNTSEGTETTVFLGLGVVSLGETDTVIDPGTIIPSVSALIAAIEDAVESIPEDYSALSNRVNALSEHQQATTTATASGQRKSAAFNFFKGRDYAITNDSTGIIDLKLYKADDSSVTRFSSVAAGATRTFTADDNYVRFSNYFAQAGSATLESDDDGAFVFVRDEVDQAIEPLTHRASIEITNGTSANFKSGKFDFLNGRRYVFENDSSASVNISVYKADDTEKTVKNALAAGSSITFLADTDYVRYQIYFTGTGTVSLESEDDGLFKLTSGLSVLSEIDVTGGKSSGYVKADGSFKGGAGYTRSSYIMVSDDMTYYYTGFLYTGTAVCGYDDKYAFVSAVLAPENSTKYTNQLLTIPEGVKYIVACNMNNGSSVFKVEAKGDVIGNMQSQISSLSVEENTQLQPDEMTSVALFERVGVLGDSFSSGGIYSISGATSGAHYGISWPTILGRMEGITCLPFARPGANAKTYLTNEYCLPAALAAGPCNLYIIMIGINAEDTEVGTVEDINDEDYTQNADTFCGNMGRIYAQVMEHAPKAKVIFVKPPLGSDARLAAIEAVADHFGVPWFNTMSDRFYKSDLYKNNKGQGHPVGVTYAGMAQAMRRQICKCMCDNIGYFIDYTGND